MSFSRKKIIGIALICIGVVAIVYILGRASSGALTIASPFKPSASLGEPTSVSTPEILSDVANDGSVVPVKDQKPAAEVPGIYTLYIPSIHVKAVVDAVGVTDAGAMATPSNLAHVGWYKYGAKPGEVGTAVFAGHVNNALLLPGTFYHLKDLKAGDDIHVISVDGTDLHFIVTDTTVYDYKNKDTHAVFATTGVPLLKLITCDGIWVPSEHTYDHRFVVTAKLVTV